MQQVSMWTAKTTFFRPSASVPWLAALVFLLLMARAAWPDTAAPYRVTITGIEDSALLKDLRDASDSLSLIDRPPASLGLLRTRAERDRDRFIRVLQAHGYFGARVEVVLEDEPAPMELAFHIDPGPVYPVASTHIRITGEKEIQPRMIPSPEKLGLIPGKPFRASVLMGAEKALVRAFEEQGFPFPRPVERKIIVDHRDTSVALEFFLDPGPQAPFGEAEVKGLEAVEESVIRRLIPWKEGDLFNVEQVETLQVRLIRLGLFSSVRVFKGRELDAQGRPAWSSPCPFLRSIRKRSGVSEEPYPVSPLLEAFRRPSFGARCGFFTGLHRGRG